MALPNAKHYRPDHEYFRSIVKATGLSQRQCAARIGVDERTMRRWILGERKFPYMAQYAVEQLARASSNRQRRKA